MANKRTKSDSGKNDAATKDAANSGTSAQEGDPASGVAPNPEQFDVGERARQDAESDQVDTDLYNTSGNDAKPPKTAEADSDSKD